MQQFIAKFDKDIQGVMSGFDRVLFRGSLRRLNHVFALKRPDWKPLPMSSGVIFSRSICGLAQPI